MTKINSNGLPAIYLYLAGKAKGVALDLQFALFLGEDATEILTYSFGEGAKFDGFGKTLPEPLYNAEKLAELGVAVEITAIVAYKYAVVKLRSNNLFSPRMYKVKTSHEFFNDQCVLVIKELIIIINVTNFVLGVKW